MKTIPLTKRPPTDSSPFPGTVDDAAIIKQIVATADPNIGMDLDGMRQAMKILDALDAVDGTGALALEDAQWELLCAKVRTFRWGIADPRFLDLADAILGAR